MSFIVGDIVEIRSYDELAAEYGISQDGFIAARKGGVCFNKSMKSLGGRRFYITKTMDYYGDIIYYGSGTGFTIADYMVKAPSSPVNFHDVIFNRNEWDPKRGEAVRIREWDDMANEYGINKYGDSIQCKAHFNVYMKHFCGMEFVVESIRDGVILFRDSKESGASEYRFTKDMIEPIYLRIKDIFDTDDGSGVFDFIGNLKVV